MKKFLLSAFVFFACLNLASFSITLYNEGLDYNFVILILYPCILGTIISFITTFYYWGKIEE